MKPCICIIGLGYIGLPLAAAFAKRGVRVYGIEKLSAQAAQIAQGKPHFYEPSLEEMLISSLKEGNLSIHTQIPAQHQINTYIITVGTPLDDDKNSRMEMVSQAIEEIGPHLKEGDLVVLRSTVKLGVTRNLVIPLLDKTGKRYHLAFCPERLTEGAAIQEIYALPQVIGANTPQALEQAGALFSILTPTIVKVSSLEMAEIIKTINNITRDTMFGIANEIAFICDALHLNVKEVLQAAQLGYSRTKLPVPGPVGGPCLTKDTYLFSQGLESTGVIPHIAMAARQTNERIPSYTAQRMLEHIKTIPHSAKTPVLTLLGIAFKGNPDTDDLRGSMTLEILHALRKLMDFEEVRGFDVMVSASAMQVYGIQKVSTLEAGFKDCDLVVLGNNHATLNTMPFNTLSTTLHTPSLVYDLWPDSRKFSAPKNNGTHYHYFGDGSRL